MTSWRGTYTSNRSQPPDLRTLVDVLIVVEDETARDIISEQASSIAFDILLEYDVSVSLDYKTTSEMNDQQQHSYIKTVQNEGRVYGD